MDTSGIYITAHALERYSDRFCIKGKKKNQEKLKMKKEQSLLKVVAFGDKVKPVDSFRKLLKYGINKDAEYFTDLIKVVVLVDKRIVTVYRYHHSRWIDDKVVPS